jgi:hypothetical protein
MVRYTGSESVSYGIWKRPLAGLDSSSKRYRARRGCAPGILRTGMHEPSLATFLFSQRFTGRRRHFLNRGEHALQPGRPRLSKAFPSLDRQGVECANFSGLG